MAKRYQFRKVYVVCEDNQVFGKVSTAVFYRDDSYAVSICSQRQKKAIEDSTMAYNTNKPIPVHKVHGFYLVHESLFDEILKEHGK